MMGTKEKWNPVLARDQNADYLGTATALISRHLSDIPKKGKVLHFCNPSVRVAIIPASGFPMLLPSRLHR